MLRRTLRMVPVLAIPALLVAGAGPAGSTGPVVRATGPTQVHAAGYGQVQTTVWSVTRGGSTQVWLLVRGLPASDVGKTLGAHVHVNACGPNATDSGPHYVNPAGDPGTPLEDREIWLDFEVRPGGFGVASASADWVIAPGGANAVVVHANPTAPTGAAGARLFCTTVPFGG